MDEQLRLPLRVENVDVSMNGKLGLKPVAQMRKSTSSSLPSVKIARFAVQPLDAGLHRDAPMDEVIEIGVAGGGMRFEQIVVRPLQAEAAMRARPRCACRSGRAARMNERGSGMRLV